MTTVLHLHSTFELNRRIRRHLTKALLIAVGLHLFAVAVYFMVEHWPDEAHVVTVRIMDVNELYQAPPLQEAVPQIYVPPTETTAPTPASGMPLIVPDRDAPAEQTLWTQEEIRTQIAAPESFGTGSGEIKVDISQPLSEIGRDPSADEFFAVEQAPVLLGKVQPEYPEIARRANLEGRVFLKALVNEEGLVTKVIVLSGDELFVEAAKASMMAARFKPAVNGNRAVKVWITFPVVFRLK